MHSTPRHAPSVMHIFPYFFRFLFIFAKSSGCQPTRCGVDSEWVGCLGVENEKGTQNWNSTLPGPTLCAEANAHFSHFSEFLLIFQHGSILTKNAPSCVFVRSFRKIQCGGDGWKEWSVDW